MPDTCSSFARPSVCLCTIWGRYFLVSKTTSVDGTLDFARPCCLHLLSLYGVMPVFMNAHRLFAKMGGEREALFEVTLARFLGLGTLASLYTLRVLRCFFLRVDLICPLAIKCPPRSFPCYPISLLVSSLGIRRQ